jgi:CheY-like chemotaxis protein
MNRYVIAAIGDLFFASKIRATAEPLAVEVKFARNLNGVIEAAKERKPDSIIVNLETDYALELVRAVHDFPGLRSVPVIGFYSHVHTQLQNQAIDAGYTHVMPRSAFTAKLVHVLRGTL